MASPHIAGLALLLMQEYSKTHGWDTSSSDDVFRIKRAILAGTFEVANIGSNGGEAVGTPDQTPSIDRIGKDQVEGWGAVNAVAAFGALADQITFNQDIIVPFNLEDPFTTNVMAWQTSLSAGLDYAHAQNIVHRDIKPANVLLDRDGMPYLSDFGIARSTAQKSLTEPDMLIGSFPYMAPEQLKGETISPQTDIYQFGIMIFELLAGQQPFFAEDLAAYVNLHTNEPIPSIHKINPELPSACDDILGKALAKESNTRYATLGEMAHELTSLIGKKTTLTLKKTVQNLSKTINQHKFEGYEIKRELGRGHMAIVYLVQNIKDNKEVVLKALPPELLDDPIAIRHLRRQAELMPELQHEAIVPIYSYRVGEKTGWPYILMAS